LTSAGDVMNTAQDGDSVGVLLVVSIVVIIVSALICFFYTIGAGVGKGAFSIFKFLPLLAIIILVAYIMIKSQDRGGYENDGDSWRILGIGIYLTLIGSVILGVSRNKSK
jgi:hypothetical protein